MKKLTTMLGDELLTHRTDYLLRGLQRPFPLSRMSPFRGPLFWLAVSFCLYLIMTSVSAQADTITSIHKSFTVTYYFSVKKGLVQPVEVTEGDDGLVTYDVKNKTDNPLSIQILVGGPNYLAGDRDDDITSTYVVPVDKYQIVPAHDTNSFNLGFQTADSPLEVEDHDAGSWYYTVSFAAFTNFNKETGEPSGAPSDMTPDTMDLGPSVLVTDTPEPSSILLMCVGMAGLACFRKRIMRS